MSKVCKIGLAEWDDRTPVFARMSKGLGINYLTERMIRWHRNDLYNRMYCNVDGKKIAMPRYYKKKLYEWFELNMINEYLAKQKEEKDALTPTTVTHWQVAQAVAASFERMKINHNHNRKL